MSNKRSRKPDGKFKRRTVRHLRLRKSKSEKKPTRTQRPKQSMEYKEYMASPEWFTFRSEYIAHKFSFGPQCEICNASGESLTLHHKHYENLTNETFQDVILLCKSCHTKADLFRKSITKKISNIRKRLSTKLYESGFYLFAHKKYGPAWKQSPGEKVALRDWLDTVTIKDAKITLPSIRLMCELDELLEKRLAYGKHNA